MEEKFQYQIHVRWAWLFDLSGFIEKRLSSADGAAASKPAKVKKGKSRKAEAKAIPKEPDSAAQRSAESVAQNDQHKTASPDPIPKKSLDSDREEETPISFKGKNFQEIMEYLHLAMQYKDMFFTFLIKLFRLLHIKPLHLQGQLGVEDPADTAFLFSALYTLLPFLPFCYFTVQPVFTGSTCRIELTLKCRISITEILLHLLLDKDLRRPLIQAYKLYRAAEL